MGNDSIGNRRVVLDDELVVVNETTQKASQLP